MLHKIFHTTFLSCHFLIVPNHDTSWVNCAFLMWFSEQTENPACVGMRFNTSANVDTAAECAFHQVHTCTAINWISCWKPMLQGFPPSKVQWNIICCWTVAASTFRPLQRCMRCRRYRWQVSHMLSRIVLFWQLAHQSKKQTALGSNFLPLAPKYSHPTHF